MKNKEIPPAAFIGVIAVLVIAVIGWFLLSGRVSNEKIDLKTVDMKDEDPPRPGQPGYQERTTDPPK